MVFRFLLHVLDRSLLGYVLSAPIGYSKNKIFFSIAIRREHFGWRLQFMWISMLFRAVLPSPIVIFSQFAAVPL